MPVIGGLNGLPGSFGVSSTRQGLKPFLAVNDDSSIDFRRARARLLNLYTKLEELAELAGVKTRFKLDLPDARSASSLGLDLTHTAASLNSIDEINATPMSFSPFGPDWLLGSNALLTIGGVYDGSNLTDTLTFESRNGGTHGTDNLRIRMEDSLGNRVNLNIRKNDPIDQQYDLGNGLFLTLGAGDLTKDDTTTIQVYDNVGAVVDPGKPLGGIRNSNPNLEFGMPSIVDGAFSVNGENISVTTADSINDVINRINLSSAGVTAMFNSGTERIDFLQNTLGSVPTIDLQGDTSNFLAATKLDAALVTPGIDPENEKALQDVAVFSSVQDGNIVINGKQISIDTANDSLDTVLDRINSSSADVVATFDPGTQEVVIEANDSASQLDLDSNGTAFFAALKIQEGQVDAEAKSGGVSRKRSYDIADAMEAAFAELNYLFRDASFTTPGGQATAFRSYLDAALQTTFGGAPAEGLFGIRFDDSLAARARGETTSIDRRTLTRNLQLRGDAVQNTLASRDGESGLVRDLLQATRQALTDVNRALGISGTFVDTFA